VQSVDWDLSAVHAYIFSLDPFDFLWGCESV